MPRNIEIKAIVRNLNDIIGTAQRLSQSSEILNQRDVFFNVNNGRLKLRHFPEKSSAELIYYERPDTEGPKLSKYDKCTVNNGLELESVLSQALGNKGVVQKTRHLYIVGQTRVHIDIVENLGNFMELEVMLSDDQTAEEGQKIAESLMSELGIYKTDLISGAYMDLLLQKSSPGVDNEISA